MATYTQPVVFELSGLSYGIDITRVSSIENDVTYTQVPNSAPYIMGIMNLRGSVIPVFDLKKRFNIQNGVRSSSMIIVNLKKTIIGIAVDAVKEINNIPAQNIVDMPSLIKKQDTTYFDRVANVNGRLIVLLDIDVLIPEEDQEAYNKMTEEISSENGIQ